MLLYVGRFAWTHGILHAPVVKEGPLGQCCLSFLLKSFLRVDVSWKENVKNISNSLSMQVKVSKKNFSLQAKSFQKRKGLTALR